MYPICPYCKSNKINIIETKVDLIKCKCLDCGKEFKTFPTKKLIEEFNGS